MAETKITEAWTMERWTWLVVVAALSAVLPAPPATAQTSAAVGVVTTLDGRANVARPALTVPLALKFKDDVFGRDRISTQQNSLVRVLLGGRAILTVRELTQVSISEEPGRAVVTLPDGKVVLAVAKGRLRPGESIEIRTPNAVAAVRGSVMSVAHEAARSFTTAICGSGDCTYQFGTGLTNVLPAGQAGKNALIVLASPAEMTEAFNVRAGAAHNEPDGTVTDAIMSGEMGKAAGVAYFASGTTPPPGLIIATPTVQQPQYTPLPAGGPTPPPSTPPASPPPAGDGSAPNGQKIVNGGFETGNFNGWTRRGNLGFTGVSTGFYARTGTYGAQLGPIGSLGFLSQTFSTIEGKPYIVTFSLRNLSGPNNFSASWAGESIFSQVNIAAGDWQSYSFTEIGTGSSTVLEFGFRNDPSYLALDDVSVVTDPPLYFLGSGDTLTRTGSEPLVRFTGTPQTFDSLMIVCCGGRASLAGPLLQATNSDLTVPFSLVSVIHGGSLVSTATDPLVQLLGGTHSFGSMGLPMFDLAGVQTATDPETGLTLGTDRPLQTAGSLLDTSQAAVNAHQAVRVDAALLEASAPLLALRNGSNLTTATDAVQLSYQAKVTSLGSLVKLDRSTMVVAKGAALNIAGGSLLRVTGDLFSLVNGSTLSVLSGPLVSLSGGSILSVNGALIGFGGTGGNLVSVANNLCPCTTVGGIPVSLTGGALASNVSIAGAIKNGNLGSLNLAPNAAVIRVDGVGTKVTINGM